MEPVRTKIAYLVGGRTEIKQEGSPNCSIVHVLPTDSVNDARYKWYISFDRPSSLKYTDVRGLRRPEEDLYQFGNIETTMNDMKRMIDHTEWVERMSLFVKNNPDSTVLIFQGDRSVFWGPNSSGFTMNAEYAGRYKIQEAFEIIRSIGLEKKIELHIDIDTKEKVEVKLSLGKRIVKWLKSLL